MLSPRAAAAILRVSPRRVQEFIRDGRIAAENIGTAAKPRYVIQEQEVERFAALDRPGHRPRKESTMDIIDQAIRAGDIERLTKLLHRAKEYGDTPAIVRLRQALFNALGQSDILLAAVEREFDPE